MDCIPQYIDGKWKPETVHYPDPCLEDILKETYGVMVYQEQVMQVAQRIAGFSLGGADMLRRAMGKKKPEVLMGKKKEFIEGAIKNGFTEEHAADIFEIMVPFAGYGFNKSHAAAYSVVAYRTAYLKAHFPAEFIAANLTNEISSTDKLPQYIAEGRSMGIEIDPPDINRSDSVFDVVDGRIVFGLQGIKGMGEAAAEEIINKRKKDGPFKSFMDFLKRVDLRTVNKGAVEVLIKTGAFDNVGIEDTNDHALKKFNRATLLLNAEQATEYVENIKINEESGQGDLFGDTEEKTFVDFVFSISEDMPPREKLNMEKDCIGCYVSGHPLDEYRKVIETSISLTSQNIERAGKEAEAEKNALLSSGQNSWQSRNSGKSYTILGIISGLRIIYTKKDNKPMAFAKLQDIYGEIDLTFFPKTWAILYSQIKEDGVYCFKGKVDGSRETPSFLVDSIEPIEQLKQHSIKELHIELDNSFNSEADLSSIKEFLFAKTGSCYIYFHIDTQYGNYIVKANQQLTVQPDKELIQQLLDMPFVKDVWTE